MKDCKVIKEYDVVGEAPFTTVFSQREKRRNFWERVSLWFSRKWYFVEMWYHEKMRYIKNIILFNKMAKNYYPWDYQSQIDLFVFGLETLANYMEKRGHEVDWSRNKKVAAIRELVHLLKNGYENGVDGEYLGKGEENVITHVTEYEDGSTGFEVIDEESKKIKEESSKRYQEELKKARKAYFDRVFYLIKGQDLGEQFGSQRDDENLEEFYKRWDKFYEENFDGSGIQGWWD
jgi:hypothetical protein